MNRAIVGVCVAVAFATTVAAQDKGMAMNKMDHMAKDKTYSGCIESSQTGSFTLTHVAVGAKKSMGKGNSMNGANAMTKGDSLKNDDAMGHETMVPASLGLSAASLNLNKFVGHKVTVTGGDGDSMNGMATFKVKSLKVIAASCS